MKASKLYMLILVLFLTTPLRAGVIVLMPLALLLVYKIHPYTITKKTYVLILLFLISGVVGLLSGTTYLANFFLSCYIVLPLLIILFAKPNIVTQNSRSANKLQLFIKYLVNILIWINVIGIIAYFVIYQTTDDDALHFAYGAHFAGVNGLAMLNASIFLFFLSKIIFGNRQIKTIRNAAFFFISFVFCFFGTGLICLIITLGVYGLFRANIKQAVIIVFGFGLVFYTISQLAPRTFNYMLGSVTIDNDLPRKLLMFQAYSSFVDENRIRAAVGVGPGGYNGRVAFLLNRESDNLFTAVFGHKMPIYHEKSIFPLWNKGVASFEAFTDGARNKPFSSIVSIAAEYGIIFGVLFLIYYIIALVKARRGKNDANLFLFLIFIFWILTMTVDMWLESSEFLFFVVFQYLIRADSAKIIVSTPPNETIELITT